MSSAPDRPRLCIGGIVYNEEPYLLEWIAFHLVQGVEHFYLGDHDSDDGTTALLEGLQALGYVTRVFHAREHRANAQRNVYETILERTRATPHLVALIDADEYLVPMRDDESSGEAIRALMADPAVGALGLNWLMFGSSGRIEPGQGLVTERFVQCNERDSTINRHIKSVVKPACVTSAEVHRCLLRSPYHYINSAGERRGFDHTNGFAREIPAVDGRVRIHHYVVKSYREFIERKAKRGRATIGPGVRRDRKFFKGHDKTGNTDYRALAWYGQVKARMQELRRELAATNASRRLFAVQVQSRGDVVQGSFFAEPALAQPRLWLTRYLAEGRADEHAVSLHRSEVSLGGQLLPEGPASLLARYEFRTGERDLPPAGAPQGWRLRLEAHPQVLLDQRPPPPAVLPAPVAEGQPEEPVDYRLEYAGLIEQLSATRAVGWVRRWDDDSPVTVEVFDRRRPVIAQQATRFRPDLLLGGQHPTGHCGFDIDLSGLRLSPPRRLEVHVQGVWHRLAKAPGALPPEPEAPPVPAGPAPGPDAE